MEVLKKLKQNATYKTLINNFFIIAISLICVVCAFDSFIYLIILLILYIYLLLKNTNILKVVLIINIIVFIYTICLLNQKTLLNISKEIEVTGLIYEKKENTSSYTYDIYTLKGKYKVICKENYEISDVINVSGVTNITSGNRIPNSFNYLNYLKYNHFKGVINATNSKKTSKILSPFMIKTYINTYLETNFNSENKAFIKALLFANTTELSSDYINAIKQNQIVHLFAVSGLHIGLFIAIFDFIFTHLKIKKHYQNIFIYLFLVTYLFITNFSPSILRVFLVVVLKNINNQKNLLLSPLDLQSISFTLLVLTDPFKIQNSGLILSYFATFAIILTTNHLRQKPIVAQIFLSSVAVSLLTLPEVISFSYYINLLTPILNIFYITITSILILPLTVMAFILNNFLFFNHIFKFIITMFLEVVVLTSKIDIFNLYLPCFSPLIKGIYYVILILFLLLFAKKISIKNIVINKYVINIVILLVLILLLVINVNNGINKKTEVHFLDLKNGESTVVVYKNEVMVVDTGDVSSDLSNFLMSKAIRKIKYLVLTHPDKDHIANYKEILNNFKCENVIISTYDNYNYDFNGVNVIKVKAGNTFNLKDAKIKVISPYIDSNNTNKNSIVLLFTIDNINYLLLADLTKDLEDKIITLIDRKIDILKVGHHGSSTSTSDYFISKIKPKIAVIMTGQKSMYSFPHKQTIDTLNKYNVIIKRCDYNYTISVINGKITSLK